MLGVPVEKEVYLFGDKKSVVKSATIPHSQLAKRWNALSYHRFREAIATGWVVIRHLAGKFNPWDCLTKNLSWQELASFTQVLMVQTGELLDSELEEAPTEHGA